MNIQFIAYVLILALALPAHAEQEHNHNHDDDHDVHNRERPGSDGPQRAGDDDHGAHELKSTNITEEQAIQAGIKTALAQAASLEITETLYGRVVHSPDHESHIRARFPGLITSVKVNIGDWVKQGDELARIESNESLQTYTLKSAIAGQVIERHANPGETTGSDALFVVASDEVVWAELKVFSSQQSAVKSGSKVAITEQNNSAISTISHIVPPEDDRQPFTLARVKLINPEEIWQPGMLVEARVVVDTVNARVAVNKNALQQMEGNYGVFIKLGDEYRFQPLTTGKSNEQYVQVLDGLQLGDEYVSDNSWLLKADIEKSAAAHHHH